MERNIEEINAKLEMQFLKVNSKVLSRAKSYIANDDHIYWLPTQLQQVEENLDDLLNNQRAST